MKTEWKGTPIEQDLDQLVIDYMGTAQSIAVGVWKMSPQNLDLGELKSIAYLGLVQAADRWPSYCEARGFDPAALQFFFTFARRRIYGAIIDQSRANDWATRSLRAKAKLLRDAGQDQGASVSEMAERSGLSEKEVNSTIHSMSNKPVSIEAEELDYAGAYTVESSVVTSYLLSVLVLAMRELEPAAQALIALHYYGHYELQEVAQMIGLTETRASRLHTDSVIKLKAALAEAAASQDLNFPS